VEGPLDRLTDKQRFFVERYLVHRCGARAAREAGYGERGSRTTAGRLLANADIRAAIQARTAEAAMEADEVLARLAAIARGSLEDFIKIHEIPADVEGGEPVGYDYSLDLAKAKRHKKLGLLAELSRNEHGVKLKLHSPLQALELLGRHHQLFVDKKDLDIRVTGFEGWTQEELDEYARTGQRPSRNSRRSHESDGEAGAGETEA
jgi:phage terminase small subunit